MFKWLANNSLKEENKQLKDEISELKGRIIFLTLQENNIKLALSEILKELQQEK